jgi:CRP-like cAMP-binding protein
MATVAEHLAAIPFMRRVPSLELRRVAPSFRVERLTPGSTLWQYGEAVAELGLLIDGELVAYIAGREVGRVRAPDLIGEASAFFAGMTRSASLTADRPSTVLVLAVSDLRALRFQKSPVYDVLLEHALFALVRRVSSTNREIVKSAVGGVEKVERKEPGVFERLWKVFRPDAPLGPCPPLAPLLKQMPSLDSLEPELEAELISFFEPRKFAEGEVLVLEGEKSDSMYVVADGEIDVLRNVRGDKAELLTKLVPGQQFGVNTMIENGPRTASCVAVRAGWLYRMERAKYDALRGPVRVRWQECILSTLASQIRNANGALARALRTAQIADERARLEKIGVTGAGRALPPVAAPATRRPGQGHDDAVNAQSGVKFSYGSSRPPTPSSIPITNSPASPDTGKRAETDSFADLLKASGYLESLPTEERELERLAVEQDEERKKRP